ncbi:hypothetical protein F5Y04DRAFT_45399 [Hypomontagnella monticulosa]|nr:hypothetical protein F5Y04DRAFT_45399 [Hypomontagnella monticulosa]
MRRVYTIAEDSALGEVPGIDRMFFVFLRGEISSSRKGDIKDFGLTTASVSMTLSVVRGEAKVEGPKTYTIPLRTTAFGDKAHISIRDAKGAYVDCLSSSGRSDIVTDYSIPGMFVHTGTWTFETMTNLMDGTCLFTISLTQWLEGCN